MRIDVITLFPEMFNALLCGGVTGRAIEKGLLDLGLWNPRDYTHDKHKTVDDRPYGGGPGMVMTVTPLKEALLKARQRYLQDNSQDSPHDTNSAVKVVYLSPQGRRLDQAAIKEMATRQGMILVAGRYEGIDERFLQTFVDEEWSIGDYVLSGGELAAMVTIDAVARLLPGVLGHEDSAAQDSFANGLLDCPHYTRPETAEGIAVPEVLMSGDHQAIARWRMKQALGKTWLKRPDLLDSLSLDEQQKQLLAEYISENEHN